MKRKGSFLLTTGLLLIAAALCLIGYNIWDADRAETAAVQTAEKLIMELPTPPAPLSEVTDMPLEEIEYPDYLLNPGMEMPILTVDGLDCIGVLSIPDLELELPVQSEWSYPNLQKTPCRYLGTAYQGHFIISAHNYRRHFGQLHTLRLGSSIVFTDADGNVFPYIVSEICTLAPTDIEEMESGDWDLTLFTCTLGGRSRITVRCLRAE